MFIREFHPLPKKDSETLFDGLLIRFSDKRAIGIIVERISEKGTKYRRHGLRENKASPAEHAHI
jgi:hypothetical protein